MAHRKFRHLKRRRAIREPKRRFIIFCEGKNTEPAYFRALQRVHRDALVEIETIADAGVAYTLCEAAKAKARELGLAGRSRRALNSFEERDEVWAVFDRDGHPRFIEAVTLCRQSGVGVARSNPCFELWLILHCEDYDKMDDSRSVQVHFQNLRPEYDRKGAKIPNCDDLIKCIEIAEKRAEVQLQRRLAEGNRYDQPSTTVGLLTRAIKEASEVSQWR